MVSSDPRGPDWLDRNRNRLEGSWLPEFLPARRWFGGKGSSIISTRVVDWCQATDDDELVLLLIVAVTAAGGRADNYAVPILVQQETPSDGSAAPGFVRFLIDLITGQRSWSMRYGFLRGRLSAARTLDRAEFLTLPVRPVGGEQSNSTLRLGDTAVLKLYRRMEPGPNPDVELTRFLTDEVSFPHVPPYLGSVQYQRGDDQTDLVLLQGYVPHAGNAWEQALAQVETCLSRAGTVRPLPPGAKAVVNPVRTAVLATMHPYADRVRLLGLRTAELHRALASSGDAEFRPEPLTAGDLTALADRIRTHFEKAVAAFRGRPPSGPEAELFPALAGCEAELDAFLRAPPGCQGLVKTRCHGDYHLGQVLWTGGDFVILDFEGEPTRPLPERRAKHSPLKDVAGMVRSFGYAAEAGLRRHAPGGSADLIRQAAEIWESTLVGAFLQGYRSVARPSEEAEAAWDLLLHWLILDKALYEVDYEINNRPEWVGIPLRAVLRLLGG